MSRNKQPYDGIELPKTREEYQKQFVEEMKSLIRKHGENSIFAKSSTTSWTLKEALESLECDMPLPRGGGNLLNDSINYERYKIFMRNKKD